MPLLNYSTKIDAEKTASAIVGLLVGKGARAVLMDYDGQGHVVALSFKVDTPHGSLPFTLPVDVEACRKILYRQHLARQGPSRSQTTEEHARRVAWRIVKDWVEAQMALLETEMVKLEQIFLPYMRTASGETLYDRMVAGGFKALAPPEERS